MRAPLHAPRRAVLTVALPLAGLTFLASAFLGGCGTSYAAPKLHVTDAHVTDRTENALVLDIIIEADNSNEESLPLREVRYEVFLGDRKVFSGFRSPESTLRRFGTQTVRLPAIIETVPGQAVPSGTANYRVQGELMYVTPGAIAEILFDNDVRRPTVNFSENGQVDLSAGPTPTVAKGS